jgi:hypothetical protein
MGVFGFIGLRLFGVQPLVHSCTLPLPYEMPAGVFAHPQIVNCDL